jgi:hypothetical protein
MPGSFSSVYQNFRRGEQLSRSRECVRHRSQGINFTEGKVREQRVIGSLIELVDPRYGLVGAGFQGTVVRRVSASDFRLPVASASWHRCFPSCHISASTGAASARSYHVGGRGRLLPRPFSALLRNLDDLLFAMPHPTHLMSLAPNQVSIGFSVLT